MGTLIKGFGKAQPSLAVKNEDIEKIVDTSDEWIFSRTGIKERRISVNESTLDLAESASLRALGLSIPEYPDEVRIDSSGKAISRIDPADIDLIILTTITSDTLVPSCAAALKKRLGATNAIAFDLNAACTGFIYGISVAESMMASSHSDISTRTNSKPIKRALVVSSERMSRVTDWQDRNTCVLFGDGAGAITLEWSNERNEILSMYLENSDDDGNSLVSLHSFDTLLPFNQDGVICDERSLAIHRERNSDPKEINYEYIQSLDLSCDPARAGLLKEFDLSETYDPNAPIQKIIMNGQKVFKFASKAMERSVREAAEMAGIEIEEIDLIVPHQANFRIIEFASKRLGIPLDKFQITIDKTGNSSSSCLPMALSDAVINNKISKGSIICLVAFGGGLTCGATILKL